MAWAEIRLSITRDHLAAAEAALEEYGALAVTLMDDADHPVLEPAPGTAPLWPVVGVRGLFPLDVGRADLLRALLELPGVVRPQAVAWREVADQAWERAWMDRFAPMQFGQNLWIVPSGMPAPPHDQAVILRLDPGLAFGTGTHPTTALCLQWMDQHDFADQQVLDYGCGSGVLGLAAALKGAARVVCVDNDPQALEATAANAERNHCSDRIECRTPRQHLLAPSARGFEVVLANILAGPLIELAPCLADNLAPGGQIVLSGILAEQAAAVAAAYAGYCGPMAVAHCDGWARLCGRLLPRAELEAELEAGLEAGLEAAR